MKHLPGFRIIKALVMLALLLTVAPMLAGPQSSSEAPKAKMMQMPLVAPLFIEDSEFTSTLVLVNGSKVHTFHN